MNVGIGNEAAQYHILGIHKTDFRYNAVCQGYDMDTEKIKGKGHRNNRKTGGDSDTGNEDNNDTENPTWSK